MKQSQVIVFGLNSESIQRMTYYPASSFIQVNTLTQELYFDLNKNIYEQLKIYRALSKYTDRVSNQRVIDLGSVESAAFVYP